MEWKSCLSSTTDVTLFPEYTEWMYSVDMGLDILSTGESPFMSGLWTLLRSAKGCVKKVLQAAPGISGGCLCAAGPTWMAQC